jgi:hypothetical protein
VSFWLQRSGWVVAAVALIAVVASVAQIARGGPLDPPRAPASTEAQLIFQPSGACPAGFPISISTPGSYKLGENITGCSGVDGIVINVSGVTLDLAGFNVAGVPGSLSGIHANCASACQDIHVVNGVVHDWGANGVSFDATVKSSAIEHVTVAQTGQRGMSLLGNQNAARDCAVRDSPLGVSNIFVSDTGVVERCVLSGTGVGIFLGGTGSVARQNIVEKPGGSIDYGIEVVGIIDSALDNEVRCNYGSSVGIYIGTATNSDIVQGNRVESCNWGIYMPRVNSASGKANLIDGNTVIANNIGIQVDQGSSASQLNVIQRNIATANGDGNQNYSITTGLFSGNDAAPTETAGNVSHPNANINN